MNFNLKSKKKRNYSIYIAVLLLIFAFLGNIYINFLIAFFLLFTYFKIEILLALIPISSLLTADFMLLEHLTFNRYISFLIIIFSSVKYIVKNRKLPLNKQLIIYTLGVIYIIGSTIISTAYGFSVPLGYVLNIMVLYAIVLNDDFDFDYLFKILYYFVTTIVIFNFAKYFINPYYSGYRLSCSELVNINEFAFFLGISFVIILYKLANSKSLLIILLNILLLCITSYLLILTYSRTILFSLAIATTIISITYLIWFTKNKQELITILIVTTIYFLFIFYLLFLQDVFTINDILPTNNDILPTNNNIISTDNINTSNKTTSNSVISADNINTSNKTTSNSVISTDNINTSNKTTSNSVISTDNINTSNKTTSNKIDNKNRLARTSAKEILTKDKGSGRFVIWKTCWQDIIKEYPIFGLGAGDWKIADIFSYNGQGWSGAHNMVVAILCEFGFVGFLIFIFLILRLLYSYIKSKKEYSIFMFLFILEACVGLGENVYQVRLFVVIIGIIIVLNRRRLDAKNK